MWHCEIQLQRESEWLMRERESPSIVTDEVWLVIALCESVNECSANAIKGMNARRIWHSCENRHRGMTNKWQVSCLLHQQENEKCDRIHEQKDRETNRKAQPKNRVPFFLCSLFSATNYIMSSFSFLLIYYCNSLDSCFKIGWTAPKLIKHFFKNSF